MTPILWRRRDLERMARMGRGRSVRAMWADHDRQKAAWHRNHQPNQPNQSAETQPKETPMAHNTVTITGNLAADPELKFTPSGKAVASLTIADTPRRYDQATQQWVDGETLWLRGSLWQEAAENAAESLRKGMRVIATGRLVQRKFTTRDGQDRTVIEMQIDEIGPSLRYARAQVAKNPPRGQGQPAQGQGGGGWGAPAGGADDDPWATQGGAEPPF